MPKNLKPVIVSVIVVAAIGGLIFWSAWEEKSRPGQDMSIQGREHIPVGAQHPAYNSNPPTSGSHYAEPADWGFYGRELPDEQLIHNLEHGGIWVAYKDIDDASKAKLEALARKYSGSVIVSLRPANDAKIALASWGRLDKMDALDEERIIKFIKANKNKSPEKLAR